MTFGYDYQTTLPQVHPRDTIYITLEQNRFQHTQHKNIIDNLSCT